MTHYILEFDQFDPVFSVINLPADFVMLRGYSTKYSAISERPAYFTSHYDIASGYVHDSSHVIGVFVTTRPLRLYDLRFIYILVREYIKQRKSNRREVLASIHTLTMAYGLCSFQTQMKLIEKRYATNPNLIKDQLQAMQTYLDHPTGEFNPVEVDGVRIAETSNDAYAVHVLKELFGNTVDGYIVPKLWSPFHIEKTGSKLNAEILLFNPENAGIRLNPNVTRVTPTPIISVLNGHHRLLVFTHYDTTKVWVQRGGDSYKKDPNDYIHKHHSSLARRARRAVAFMKPVDVETDFNRVTPPLLTSPEWPV